MRDKPGAKKSQGSSVQIRRIKHHCVKMKVVAYVIQCHYDHNNAAKYVDRFDTISYQFLIFQFQNGVKFFIQYKPVFSL